MSYLEYRRAIKNGTKPPPESAKEGNRTESVQNEEEDAGPVKPAKKVPRQPIAKRSAKMKDIMKALKSAYGPYLKAHAVCGINSPDCQGKASCIHHTEGRGIKVVLNQSTWMPACGPCNSWVENHDAEAREKGFKKSRLYK